MTTAAATRTVSGIPVVLSNAKLRRAGAGSAVKAPLVICRSAPVSRAFTPSVEIRGVIPSTVTAKPDSSPESTQATTTKAIPLARPPSVPLGYFVMMMAASEIIPVMERSKPLCWTTSV